MLFSIVIRAYNEEEHIGRLLSGILQQTLWNRPLPGGQPSGEIILVDSGSTDATVAIASHFPVKIVHIRPEEFTFGYSLNKGIEAAAGEFIVMASAHVYPVYMDWLEHMLAPFSDPKIALVYGKQRGMATTKFSEHQVFARWFPDQSVRRQTHPFCNNANAAIRRSLWQEHPYDETLTGLEDLAWGRWAIEKGYLIAYAAEAEIIHVHNEKPRQVYNRYRREAMAFKRVFPSEHFSLWDFFRLTTTNTLSDLWHAAQQRVFLENWRSVLWFRFLQFWGTYRGYRQANQSLTGRLRQTFYYPLDLQARSEGPPPSGQSERQPIDYRSAQPPS